MRVITVIAVLALALACKNASSQKSRCPDGMVLATESVCIDVYEWPNKKGVRPLVYASGVEDSSSNNELTDADTLCASSGKRVCTKHEWQSACGEKYPYGDKFDPTACNTEKKFRDFDAAKIANYDEKELKRLDQSSPSGSYTKCRSPSGAYDMVGNGEEWVTCPEGKYGWCLMGRYWAERGSCKFVVTKHSPNWHLYETSLRCCSDTSKTERVERMSKHE